MSDITSTIDLNPSIEHNPTAAVEAHTLPLGKSRLDVLADSIRTNHRSLITAVFAIGRDLKEAKQLSSHGKFGDWLAREFAWSTSTANRYMQAHSVWGQKEALVGDLETTGIYLLTAKGTPPELRDEIEVELEQGQRPSLSDIRKRVKEARQAASGETAAPDRETKAQDAAAFILDKIVDELPRLHELLQGVDPVALVKALRMRRTNPQQAEQVAMGLP